jgi:hypothetical protein
VQDSCASGVNADARREVRGLKLRTIVIEAFGAEFSFHLNPKASVKPKPSR